MLTVKVIGNEKGNPPGKLADVELQFGEGAGPLVGMRLVGFAVWERRTGNGRNVTMPARQHSVNGERRSYALLRPMVESEVASTTLRNFILDAYAAHEAEQLAVNTGAIAAQVGL